MKFFKSFHPYALTTSFFWSLAYVLSRVCLKYFTAFQVGFLRCFVASCAMLAVVLVTRMARPKLRDLKWFALSGTVGFFLYMLCFNKGCAMVTTATGNVMLAVTPVVTAVAARFLFREKLRGLQWTAIGVCFLGVAVLTALSGGFTANAGLAWLMLAVLLMASYNLLQRFLSRRCPPLMITAYSIFFGTLELSIFAPGAAERLPQAPASVLPLLLILGVCCSGVAYCTWTKAFSLARNASSVSNYMFINPFISSIMGLFIGDAIGLAAATGGAIVMAGLFLFNFGEPLADRFRRAPEKKP